MKRLIALTLILLLSACASENRRAADNSAGGGDFAPAPVEPMKATLEECRATGWELMGEKKWEEALGWYSRAAQLTSDPHSDYYNIACCLACLGRKQEAVDALYKARETGVNNYPFVAADAHLAKLKGFAPFDQLMADLKAEYEAARKAAGEILLVEVPTLGEVRVRLPRNFDKTKKYPLVVGLHEYGGNAFNFVKLIDQIGYKDDFIFAAVNGPYAVSENDENPGGRWWWLHNWPDDGWQRSRKTTVATVMAARKRVIESYPVDEKRVYLLGYRQGGTAAMLVASSEAKSFAGFMAIGAHHLGDAAKIEGAFHVLLCHAPKDEKLAFTFCNEAKEIWSRAGATVAIEELTVWDSLGADATSAIASWLHERFSEEP